MAGVSPEGEVELEVDGDKEVETPLLVEVASASGARVFGGGILTVEGMADLGTINGSVGSAVTRTVSVPVNEGGRRRLLKANVTGSLPVSAGEVRFADGIAQVDVVIDVAEEAGAGRFEVIVEDRAGPVGAGRGKVVITAPLLSGPSSKGLPSRTFSDLPTSTAMPVVRPSGACLEGVGGEGGLLQLGDLQGKAMEKSYQVIALEFPVEARGKMHADLKCEYDGVSVQEIRGAGDHAEVVICLEGKRSFVAPFSLRVEGVGRVVEGEGRVVMARADPYVFGLQTLCGSQTKGSPPLKIDFVEDKQFAAWFEPKIKEFWLSESKGTIEAEAKVCPFDVFFAPRDPRPIDSLLFVDTGDYEIVIQVCGSIGGFQGRKWGERRTRH